MVDRPKASTSIFGRPRKRSQSAHLPTCIPIASKTVRPRAKSVQKTQVKGKGTDKDKGAKKKLGETVVVVSSDSEDIEVDFPCHPPNQPQNIPAEEPQEPNHPLDIPAEGPREPEEPQQPVKYPAEGAEEPQEPHNPNPLPQHPPILMANNQLNWSHFRPKFSGKPEEDTEAHLLRTNDWMNTQDFPEDQKVRRFCLTLSAESRLWYATLNIQQQQLDWAGLQK